MELLISLFKFIISFFSKKDLPELPEKNENRFTVTKTLLEKEYQRKKIICNGAEVEIKWPKVILWNEMGGLTCGPGTFKKRSNRNPKMFVVHWDGCLNSRQMAEVLKERGLSVHFAIDNDGTIYQLLDTKDVAWHAKGVNTQSVGVEIANAVELRHNKWYKNNGFEKRPIIPIPKLNGKQLPPVLGFYPQQIEALKALIEAVSGVHSIPLQVPLDKGGNLVMGVDKRVAGRSFSGIVGHFHVTSEKVDPVGLPFEKIIQEIKDGDNL